MIGLTYQKFLHLTAQHDCVSQTEYKLSSLQLHANAMEGIHGMEMELATCLGAVMAQVAYLDDLICLLLSWFQHLIALSKSWLISSNILI